MFRRLTSAWTDAHVGLAAGAAILATLGAVAATGSISAIDVALATIAVSLATFMLASLTDAFGGMLVGLIAAACLTAIRQYVPDATPVSFATQAVTLGLLFMLGMTSGMVADRVRRASRIAAREGGQAIMPVEGSLGLMSAADAATALSAERARAELHQRPLSTATIRVDFTHDGLDAEDERRARRAVARSLETELRVTDLVYLDDDGHFGAILPETTTETALVVVESALMVASAATFADREAGHRKCLSDVAELRVELTSIVTPTPVTPVPARPTGRRRPHPNAAKSSGAARQGSARQKAGHSPTEPAEAH